MNKIPLANVIAALRDEIEVARTNAAQADLKFTVSNIELELEVVIQEDTDAKFGVKFFGVDVGVGGERSEGSTHRVKLTLNPHVPGADGQRLNPEISQEGQW